MVRDAHLPERVPIDSYGDGGFRFRGMSHRGSLLCLPSGVHGWKEPAITAASLQPVFDEADGIEFLILGTGATLVPPPSALRDRFRAVGIVVETMSTSAAVRTFNIVLGEGRAIAAALMAVD